MKSNTGTVEQVEQIDHLDFDVSCDYVNCTVTATHRLICAKCGLFEFMCDPHAEAAKQAPKDSWIVFDKSCKHRVDMYYCGKEPI
ncbi:MAG: hypothetical protein RIQ88_260 [Actinomycetota bacterium]